MSEYDYDKAPTNPHHGGKMTPTDMVRRIEELEAKLSESEALLAKAVEALVAFNSFDDLPVEAKRPDIFEIKVRMPILRTLAQLTEDTDE